MPTGSFITLHSLVLLPNADDAVIDPAMRRDYLLSTQHSLGRFASPALVDNEIFLHGHKYLYAIAAR
jgi:hypothetical protein